MAAHTCPDGPPHTSMFRFIHTSDWHIGHTLYGYDRHDEQLAMLVEIARICRDMQPDALLISGDIYDSAQPTAAAQRMFTDAMVSIRHDCADMTIIATAGNHDSPTRHETAQALWRELNIVMTGTLADDPEQMIVNAGGHGLVIPVPYVNKRFLPDGYIRTLIQTAMKNNHNRLPIVMMAHAAIAGCDNRGHDNLDNGKIIGNIETIGANEFYSGYDYLALGHIHRRQTLGNHRIQYSGSPMAIGFDEAYTHGVTMVSIDSYGADPQIQHIDIEPLRPLVTLPSVNSAAPFNDLIAMVDSIKGGSDIYLRLNLDGNDTSTPPDARQVIADVTAGKDIRFCHLNRQYTGQRGDRRPSERSMTMDFNEFRRQTPISIAAQYAAITGEIFDASLEKMLDSIVKTVTEESRQ